MSTVRSAGAAGEETQGFSALLASLDGLSAAGLVAGSVAAADTQEDKPALTSLAQEDALLTAQGHAPWMSLVGQTARLDAQGNVDLSLVKQATRLNSQSDVDLSLVGQTARLDAKGDASQSVTTDFLSGRGNITQLAHRQELQQGLPSAHAALQTQDIQKIPIKPIRDKRKQLLISKHPPRSSPRLTIRSHWRWSRVRRSSRQRML